MTIKVVRVRIDHEFETDIPEDLLVEGDYNNEMALDEFLYEKFIDSDWYFNDLRIDDK